MRTRVTVALVRSKKSTIRPSLILRLERRELRCERVVGVSLTLVRTRKIESGTVVTR